MFDIIRNKKGVALLMTIGILAIMSIIATSFALNMKLELESAANYLRSVKALYLAESGINKVIADIRSQVATNTYAGVISYVTGYSTADQSVDSLGTYQVRIGREIGSADPNIGEDQKVNLNALDDTDSTRIGTLQTNGLTYDDIAKIIDYRDPDSAVTTQLYTTGGWVACAGNETNTKNSTFSSVEEVRLIIGDTKYNNIKKYITIYGPIIRGGLLAEYYNSISGSSPNVVIDKTSFVGKVIELGEVCQWHWNGDAPWNCMPGADGDWQGWLETHDAAWAGASLLSDPGGNRINYFGVIFEGYLEVLPSEVGSAITFYMRNDDGARFFIDGTLVVNAYYNKGMDPEISGTYTFNYPGWHPIRIDYYDQADANGCALKWSLSGAADTSGTGNYIPAERLGFYPIVTHPKESGISYPSAGIYSITCVGKAKATDGTVLAEKKVTAAIKVFGTWTQTTKEEFYAAWFSDAGTQTGTTDSNKYFPGNYADGHVFNVTWLDTCPDNASGDLEAGGYTTTVNALKLGYWDDFDEDLAYTVVNLTAMARKVIEGTNKQKKWAAWADAHWAAYRINKDPANTNYFALTFEKIQPYLGSCKVQVDVNTWTELYFEANYNYYRPDTNVFARAWTTCKKDGADREPMKRLGWRGNAANVILPTDPEWAKVKYREAWDDSHYYYDLDNDGYEWRDTNQDPPPNIVGTRDADEVPDPSPVYRAYNNPSDSYPQNPQAASRVYIYTTWDPTNGWMSPALEDNYSASGAYWQPSTTYLNASVFARGDREDPWEAGGLIDSAGDGFYDIAIDRDQWEYSWSTPELNDDALEIALVNNPTGGGRAWGSLSPDSYTVTNVLGMVKGSSSNNYKAYLGNGAKSLEYWPWTWPVYPNFKFKANNAYELTWIRYQAIWMRGAPLDTVTQYFDNARFIPDSLTNPAHLASTPFYAGEDVTWGRLSFTEKNAADAQLDVAISLRTAADKASMMLLTGDTGWTSYANGAQITNTGRWLQYKATLYSTAFNKDNYANSGKTPIFQDITITYLPRVEVLYYREVTE